jgi:DNA-directed RNA polymerase subunit RPC12/RpoP
MDSETAVPEQRVSVERRQQDVASISCPSCSGAVPVLAQCIDGDVEPVLVCPDCGWRRPARREGSRST